jgi:serine protease inhibitor
MTQKRKQTGALSSLCLGLLFIQLASVSFAQVPEPDCGSHVRKNLPSPEWTQAQNNLGWTLLKQTNARGKKENFFFSPASLSSALQLVMVGAGTEARAELAKALNLNGSQFTNQNLIRQNQLMLGKFQNLENGTIIRTSFSLWTDSDFSFSSKYLTPLKALGTALEPRVEPFGEKATVEKINDWVRRQSMVRHPKTGVEAPLIDRVLEELKPDEVFVLLNAPLVDSKWQKAFESERPMHFINSNGKIVETLGMSDARWIPYHSDGDLEFASIPFADDRFSVDILVPAPGKKVDDLLQQMNADRYARLVGQAKSQMVALTLPQLDVKTELPIKDNPVFENDLGVSKIFTAGNLIPMGGSRLFISRAKQDSRFRMDQNGFQGFSVTVVTGSQESAAPMPQRSLSADRPFILVVRDRRDNQILQMALVREATTEVKTPETPDARSATIHAELAERIASLRQKNSATAHSQILELLQNCITQFQCYMPAFSLDAIATYLLLPDNLQRSKIQELVTEAYLALYKPETINRPSRAGRPSGPIRSPVTKYYNAREVFRQLYARREVDFRTFGQAVARAAELRNDFFSGELGDLALLLYEGHGVKNSDKVVDDYIAQFAKRTQADMDELVLAKIEKSRGTTDPNVDDSRRIYAKEYLANNYSPTRREVRDEEFLEDLVERLFSRREARKSADEIIKAYLKEKTLE